MTNRRVVLLCGPPGAGKSTAALAAGLEVFDRDDPGWNGERHFTQKLSELGRNPTARAVVIRTGATTTARQRAARLIAATDTFLIVEPAEVLATRIRARGRADMVRSLAAIGPWFAAFDRADGVQDFPGWAAVLNAPADLDQSEAW